MTEQFALHFSGPYTWLRDEAVPCLYESEVAGKPGIYLWGAETPLGFMVSYVGETGRSFSMRFAEHLRDQLAGVYSLPDPESFERGEPPKLLWKGMYGGDRERGIEDFAARLDELGPLLKRLIKAIRLFIAPFEGDDSVRRRIEAALADGLAEHEGEVREFLEAGIRYDRTPLPEPIEVIVTSAVPIVGLPDRLQISGTE